MRNLKEATMGVIISQTEKVPPKRPGVPPAFQALFCRHGMGTSVKEPPTGPLWLHLGIRNVIQAVITLKTKKTAGTKTGGWNAA